LEDLGFRRLRIAKVHHFIKKFVDDDKVVADGFLLERLEVLGKDLDDFVQEEEDFGGVGVAFGQGEEVEVVVADVEILFASLLDKVSVLLGIESVRRTLIPSWEKHGGTADDSSSASDRRIGNFSTADMGMSPL
jgi:hypothetical protein